MDWMVEDNNELSTVVANRTAEWIAGSSFDTAARSMLELEEPNSSMRTVLELEQTMETNWCPTTQVTSGDVEHGRDFSASLDRALQHIPVANGGSNESEAGEHRRPLARQTTPEVVCNLTTENKNPWQISEEAIENFFQTMMDYQEQGSEGIRDFVQVSLTAMVDLVEFSGGNPDAFINVLNKFDFKM